MRKKVPILLMCLLLFLMATKNVKSNQDLKIFHLNDGKFYCDVWAPTEVKAGEQISVTIVITPWATLQVDTIHLWIYGNIGLNGEWSQWEYTWQNVTMYYLQEYEVEETFVAHASGISPGRIYGVIEGFYEVDGEHRVFLADFEIARVYEKTQQEYQRLESDCNSLNYSHSALQGKYDSLETHLNVTTILMYALMITTIVFIVTTIYFAVRKPKMKPS